MWASFALLQNTKNWSHWTFRTCDALSSRKTDTQLVSMSRHRRGGNVNVADSIVDRRDRERLRLVSLLGCGIALASGGGGMGSDAGIVAGSPGAATDEPGGAPGGRRAASCWRGLKTVVVSAQADKRLRMRHRNCLSLT